MPRAPIIIKFSSVTVPFLLCIFVWIVDIKKLSLQLAMVGVASSQLFFLTFATRDYMSCSFLPAARARRCDL